MLDLEIGAQSGAVTTKPGGALTRRAGCGTDGVRS